MEMSFQKLVLTIAIIILILLLVLIGTSLSNATAEEQWPPVIGSCPDYWVDLSGNGEACFNSHSLGTCNIPSEGNKNTKNFNQSPYNGTNGTCAKYKWANACKVTWDGLTYGVSNPCNSSTTTEEDTSV
jgi:hypothetical protein